MRSSRGATVATAAPGAAPWVEVVESAEALAPHVPAWETLAEQPLEPNVFYEPWMLLPALSAFAADRPLSFVLVYRRDRETGAPMMCGFFPLARRRVRGLPMPALGLWTHVHCFLCTPLVHARHGRAALRALFEWARTARRGAGVLDFSRVHGDGPFEEMLDDVIGERRATSLRRERYERALLRPGADAGTYLAAATSAGNLKELRRQKRRLSELGVLTSRVLRPGEDVQPWIEDFLRLEASGWKGREGSALASQAAARSYFTTIVTRACAREQLLMQGLLLDGRPIALKCSFLSGRGSFAFKIAFDESFARYSPGVQLEIENIKALHARPDVHWMDSCAGPGHFMINRLWRERRTMQSVLVSSGRPGGGLVLRALAGARRALGALSEAPARGGEER